MTNPVLRHAPGGGLVCGVPLLCGGMLIDGGLLCGAVLLGGGLLVCVGVVSGSGVGDFDELVGVVELVGDVDELVDDVFELVGRDGVATGTVVMFDSVGTVEPIGKTGTNGAGAACPTVGTGCSTTV